MPDARVEAALAQPLGSGEYVVKQGDTIASIAYRTGHHPNAIWDHPKNAEIKAKRGSPGMLLPGDSLHIPTLRLRTVTLPTGQVHRFVRKGTSVTFRLKLHDADGEPLANASYELVIDGRSLKGQTNGEGQLEVQISPVAQRGTLTMTETDDVYELRLGELDPEDSATGIQARLHNLGYTCGPIDGELGLRTGEAFRAFKEDAFGEQAAKDDEILKRLGRTAPWAS